LFNNFSFGRTQLLIVRGTLKTSEKGCYTNVNLFLRFVPLAAVAAANAINLPLMNVDGIKDGIPVLTADGEELGKSAKAARSGISQVLMRQLFHDVYILFM